MRVIGRCAQAKIVYTICVFQVSAWKKLGMIGWINISSFFSKILYGIYGNCVNFVPFVSLFALFSQ